MSTSMALAGVKLMCGDQRNLDNLGSGIVVGLDKVDKKDQKRGRISGMESESDRAKHKKSLGVINSSKSFMPWSCKIPIGEGYHE